MMTLFRRSAYVSSWHKADSPDGRVEVCSRM
jgi:hypothetical protein